MKRNFKLIYSHSLLLHEKSIQEKLRTWWKWVTFFFLHFAFFFLLFSFAVVKRESLDVCTGLQEHLKVRVATAYVQWGSCLPSPVLMHWSIDQRRDSHWTWPLFLSHVNTLVLTISISPGLLQSLLTGLFASPHYPLHLCSTATRVVLLKCQVTPCLKTFNDIPSL